MAYLYPNETSILQCPSPKDQGWLRKSQKTVNSESVGDYKEIVFHNRTWVCRNPQQYWQHAQGCPTKNHPKFQCIWL